MTKIIEVSISFLSSPILPTVFFGIVFLTLAFFYFKKNQLDNIAKKYRKLISVSIFFNIFYAIILTTIQYYVWVQGKFTKILIDMPTKGILSGKYGYFLFYSFGRFWINILISLLVSYIFYIFLKFLKKYRERFFEKGELELGFLTALIAGWPNFVIFIPFVFLFVIVISIFKMIFLKEHYTTLGLPFILALLTIIVLGNKLAILLNLGFLKV